jgi:hypothetical protein
MDKTPGCEAMKADELNMIDKRVEKSFDDASR